MTTILFHRLSKFGITCVQCNNEVIAPERSEYRNERQVRHLWRCGECDFRFEFGRLLSCHRQVNEGYPDGGRDFRVAVPVAARRIGQFSGSRQVE